MLPRPAPKPFGAAVGVSISSVFGLNATCNDQKPGAVKDTMAHAAAPIALSIRNMKTTGGMFFCSRNEGFVRKGTWKVHLGTL